MIGVTILLFIVILGVLVFVHELGHFAMAKAFKIQVLEFGIGFPPRLFGVRRGETLYSINLIPLGGFVKMTGEEDPSHPRSLARKSPWIRFLVLTAGPAMNALLPVLLFIALFMVPQQTIAGDVTVAQVAPDSPAARAGVQPGDIIRKVDNRRVENDSDLRYLLNLRLGAESNWTLSRGGEERQVSLVPRFNPPEGQGATGIMIRVDNPREISRSFPFWEAVPRGARRVGEVLVLAKNEVSRWIVGSGSPQVAGPIGIAQITGEVARSGVVALIELTALLSINLAIINILPIPMLDGGRLVFVAIEVVRRGKRISPEKEGLVHLIGLAVLLSFIVVVSYFDLARIFQGDSLIR